jgi:hypothetical protein
MTVMERGFGRWRSSTAEQWFCKPQVGGSIPLASSTLFPLRNGIMSAVDAVISESSPSAMSIRQTDQNRPKPCFDDRSVVNPSTPLVPPARLKGQCSTSGTEVVEERRLRLAFFGSEDVGCGGRDSLGGGLMFSALKSMGMAQTA